MRFRRLFWPWWRFARRPMTLAYPRIYADGELFTGTVYTHVVGATGGLAHRVTKGRPSNGILKFIPGRRWAMGTLVWITKDETNGLRNKEPDDLLFYDGMGPWRERFEF